MLHAQQAGYSAAIVHNVYSDALLSMSYSNGVAHAHYTSGLIDYIRDQNGRVFAFVCVVVFQKP